MRHKSIHDSQSVDGVFAWKHLLKVPHARMGKELRCSLRYSANEECLLRAGIITGDDKKFNSKLSEPRSYVTTLFVHFLYNDLYIFAVLFNLVFFF